MHFCAKFLLGYKIRLINTAIDNAGKWQPAVSMKVTLF